jgi:lipopolysaccharide/colanic/teichoic acid biosynthesis glycosyltransferase
MYKKVFKSILDVFFCIIVFPFFLVTLIIVSMLILFDDHGPIFYIDNRIGKSGKIFKMLKFRTMKVNSPDIRLEDGSTYNSAQDARVTRVGKFLRKTSIDEIPQILNVLLGQMSIVGFRPDPVDWLDKYTEQEKVFLSVKPGITGFNQAYFRNLADSKLKIANDINYAENISFIFDIKILLRTFLTVLRREKLYAERD